MPPTHPQTSGPQIGPEVVTVERRPGRHGELVLRVREGECEIISNGTFLMDTRDGRSERLLVRSALAAAGPRPGLHVLLGGLGVGFSLAEALTAPSVARATVVECEPAVVAFNRSTTGARSGGSVEDPRVRCEIADLVTWLRRPVAETFDVVCLDVDNGPHWVVSPDNGWLYTEDGLTAIRGRLAVGGVLSVWSAAPVPTFEARLRRQFRDVRRQEIPVDRGEPDVIYLARR